MSRRRGPGPGGSMTGRRFPLSLLILAGALIAAAPPPPQQTGEAPLCR